jgi:ABC-type molybdate transport system substrate-binding protein
MARASCKSTIRIAAAALVTLFMGAAWANAAEIKVLSSVALTSALDELGPVFERTSGNKLIIDYGVAAQLRERFLAGAAAAWRKSVMGASPGVAPVFALRARDA